MFPKNEMIFKAFLCLVISFFYSCSYYRSDSQPFVLYTEFNKVYYRVDGKVESFDLDTIHHFQSLDLKAPFTNAKLQLLGVKDSIEFNMVSDASFELNIIRHKIDTVRVKIYIH